jgi:predicted dehydrogenase
MGLLHASILNTLPRTELAALCDKSRLIRTLFKKIFPKIKIVDDVQQLDSLGLDVIYVTSPIPSHYFIVKSICSEKIVDNVFVEKTLGSTFDQARELCELVQNSDGANMVGYMKRFAVTFKKAKEMLDQEIIGSLNGFKAYAYSSDFHGLDRNAGKTTPRGGVLHDLGSHVVDLASWFFGDMRVKSVSSDSAEGIGFEDQVEFLVEDHDGCQGQFAVSWCMNGYRLPEFGLTISGTKGLLKVNSDVIDLQLRDEKRRWHRQDLSDNVGFLLGDPEYFREDKHFIESILLDKKAEPSFSTASKVDNIIDQVKKRSSKDV